MTRSIWTIALLGALTPPVVADEAAELEFFESKVRPILVERCQSCHAALKQKGGLRLDGKNSMLKGGDSGPALVPGKPDRSLLIEAISYNGDLKMPPKSRLSSAEVATLTQWVERGAPWPAESAQASKKKAFDLVERAKHWSFQPIANPPVPTPKDRSWPAGDVDAFLLTSLEAQGLKPNPDADRRTLIRRLSFDLIGLPPSPAEVKEFLEDKSIDAYTKQVDRLLASPHYGERWARHWLDLVRYAETAGHEFDYETPDAWRYRDYVIEAFNEDLPYNRFVIEQLAGDLLPKPRIHSDGSNISVVGTGFYFLGEGTHSPVDLRDDQAIRIDNQVEVISKTFLGLTVNCARCHDHKFDPIRQADYYALSGFLKSSRFDHAMIDDPARFAQPVEALGKLHPALREQYTGISKFAERLMSLKAVEPAMLEPGHPLFSWLGVRDSSDFDKKRQELQTKAKASSPDDSVLFEDFNRSTFVDWMASGPAFGQGPSGLAALHVDANGITPVGSGVAHSGLVSDKLTGVLRSKTFAIKHRYVHYRAWGKGGRIHAVVDGFEKIRDPIYGPLVARVDSETPRWISQDLNMWVGRSAYLELSDGGTVLYDVGPVGYHKGDGFLAVDEIRFSDSPHPPRSPDRVSAGLLEVESRDELIDKFTRVAEATLHAWRSGDCVPAERVEWLAWFMGQGWIETGSDLNAMVKTYHELEATMPAPTFALTIADGTPEDAALAIRGNPHTPGETVARRPLEVLGGLHGFHSPSGSGRLAFAESVASSNNPLAARVMINRLWKHHFSVGLVPSTDDFGAMGQVPRHPELLDHLARKFIDSGWSVKAMHRLLESTFHQVGEPVERDQAGRRDFRRILDQVAMNRLQEHEGANTVVEVCRALAEILEIVANQQELRGGHALEKSNDGTVAELGISAGDRLDQGRALRRGRCRRHVQRLRPSMKKVKKC